MKLEVSILAGGLSTRMGRDKAALQLGGRTMLSIIRETASGLGVRVRIVRRDTVARCGPLGGVLTTLKATRADAVLFLACDMPLVSVALLRRIVRASSNGASAAFASSRDQVGFPFLLPRGTLMTVESQIRQGALSIHELAAMLGQHAVRVPISRRELINVNTPQDVAALKARRMDASLVTRAVRPYGSRHAKPADSSVHSRKRVRRQRRR